MDNIIQLRKRKVAELQERKDDLQVELDIANHLKELTKSEHFKAVIEEGLYKTEVDRITSVITTPMKLKKDTNDTLLQKLVSIRHIKEYLTSVDLNGDTAAEMIKEVEEEIIAINGGDLDEAIVEEYTIDAEVVGE